MTEKALRRRRRSSTTPTTTPACSRRRRAGSTRTSSASSCIRHIEERWNKGQFGKEWDECDDLATRRRTGTCALGLGREKIFEVRTLYNDVTFIDEFFTAEFVARAEALHVRLQPEERSLRDRVARVQEGQGEAAVPADQLRQPVHLRRGRQPREPRRAAAARTTTRASTCSWTTRATCSTRCCASGAARSQLRTVVEGKHTLLRYDGKEHTTKSL